MSKRHSDTPIHIDAAGREALYQHLEYALLHSEGEGLDPAAVKKLLGDPKVKDEHLADAVHATCIEFDRRPPELAGRNRRELAEILASVLDEGLASGTAKNPGEGMAEVSIKNPKGKPDWRIRIGGGDETNIVNQRSSNIIKGTTSNVTERVLRSLRRSAGWVPAMDLYTSINKTERQALDNIGRSYIREALQGGLDLTQAETKCQTEYIAIVPRPSHKNDPYSGQPEASSSVNIDLSPRAAEDFKQELRRLKGLKNGTENLSYVYRRLQLKHISSATNKRAVKIVNDVRAIEIQRLMEEEKLSSADASKRADETYISISPLRGGYYEYRIYPRALPALDIAIEKFRREREKRDEAKSFSYVSTRWQISFSSSSTDHIALVALIADLRGREITRLMEAESLSDEAASKKADETYIKAGARCMIYPCAMSDIDAVMRIRYPGRKPWEPREPKEQGRKR